ncbi:hypothetical protein ACHAQA_004184 [Verticillium albo-atrum]
MSGTEVNTDINDLEPNIAGSVNQENTPSLRLPIATTLPQASAQTTTTTTGASNAQPTETKEAIEWAYDWSEGNSDRVFGVAGSGEARHQINSLLDGKLVLTRGEWWYEQQTGELGLLRARDIRPNSLPVPVDLPGLRARQTLDLQLIVTENRTVLPLGYLESQQDAYGRDMFLNLTWQYGDQIGWSRSGIFTVVSENSAADTRQDMQERDRAGGDEFDTVENLPETVSDVFGNVNLTPTVLPSIARTTGLTSTPSATVASSDDDAAESAGPSGLSIGAKAGIGVGAGLVGLAIIGALVWFFCLRNRRKNKDHVNDTPYITNGRVSDYMVNKETNAAHVTESPHSPYSDDGSLAQQPYVHQPAGQAAHEGTALFGGGGAAAGPPSGHSLEHQNDSQDRGFSEATPLAAPVPRSGSQQRQHEPTRSGARSATPQGVNSNVSHLIEDGMTEDEIRRLEDEERQLDAAIERHGQGRRGA